MDSKIQELIEKANKKKYYQIMMIAFCSLIYFSTNVISTTIPFWVIEPKVNYTVDGKSHVSRLNNTICEQVGNNYSIVSQGKNTWIYSYGYACDTFLLTSFNFIANFGSLVGFLLAPTFIALIGEKQSIVWSGYMYAVVCLVNIWMPNMYSALLFNFLNNVTGTFQEIVIYMSMSEICPGKVRPLATNIGTAGGSVAPIVFTLLIYFLNSWKIPMIISAALNLVITLVIHIFMYENPRYYLKLGKLEMFVITLKKIAKFNGCSKDFDPYANLILNEYEDEVEKTKSGMILEQEQKSLLSKLRAYNQQLEKNKQKFSIIDVLRYPSHRWIFILQGYLGILFGGIYASYVNNLDNFPGNPYLTGIYTNAIELFVSLIVGPFMNIRCLKRKHIIYGGLILSLAVDVIILSTQAVGTLFVVLSQASRVILFFTSSVNGTFATELYSSKLLNPALTWGSAIGTLSSALLPTGTKYWTQNTLGIVFASMVVVGLVCVFFLPETKGKPQMTEIPERLLLNNAKNEEEEIVDN